MSGFLNLHADSAAHLAATLAALDRGEPVFLGNPRWSPEQLDEALRQIPASCRTEGAAARPRGIAPCDWPGGWRGRLMIPTGGTGGRVRFVIHDRATLAAAAVALQAGLAARGRNGPLHGAVMTPPWHVSGLMPALRARETGGRFAVADGRFTTGSPLPRIELPADGTRLVSLVPAQLARLLARPDGEAWLRQWDVVLLGGSALPEELRRAIVARRLPVALTYGMTETAAAVALAWPEDLAGEDLPAGRPLPGVVVTATDGRLAVHAPGLCRGIWPNAPMGSSFETGDLGEVLADGRVRVTGRTDRLLATGGEKVDPARVERVLCGPGLAKAAWVAGLPDATWGRLIVATVVARPEQEPALRAAADAALEPAARPRRYLFVDELPFDERGKPLPGAGTTPA